MRWALWGGATALVGLVGLGIWKAPRRAAPPVAVPFVADGQRSGAVVRERIAADTVWLGPGEARAWELAAGRYEISVHAPTPPGEPQALDLVADLKCAPDGRDADLIHCLIRVPTRLVLRHSGIHTATPRRRAVVSILRVPE